VEEIFGIAVLSIINLGHLIDYLKQGDDQALIGRIEAYRDQYGV
jgi:orotate phosphoribosyltransferase